MHGGSIGAWEPVVLRDDVHGVTLSIGSFALYACIRTKGFSLSMNDII